MVGPCLNAWCLVATPASPEEVRAGLTIVTAAAAAEVATIAQAGSNASEVRNALLVAVPIIVADYADGSSALALDWYEELREAASPRRSFTPRIVRTITDDDSRTAVALATEALREEPADLESVLDSVVVTISGSVVELVATDFRTTMTENAIADPAAEGWRRYARPEACKFCKMLADRGAVYSASTARFAAHGAVMAGNRKGGNCMCLAGPSFDPDAPKASAMQYVASRRKRTPKQRAELREYLRENFPDSRG